MSEPEPWSVFCLGSLFTCSSVPPKAQPFHNTLHTVQITQIELARAAGPGIGASGLILFWGPAFATPFPNFCIPY